MGMSGQHQASASLYPQEKDAGTHWIGGWVGLRVGLDAEARGKILYLYQNTPTHNFSQLSFLTVSAVYDMNSLYCWS
jgi:hypothetical protein